MGVWKTSRSEIITAQVCPRKSWYSRFFGGTGIQRKRTSLPLAFGSAFHAGAEKLLAGDVEGAVASAHLYLDLVFSNKAIEIEDDGVAYAIGEQKAIVEGLIRGWWTHEGERFLRDFEVVEVEQEGEAELAPNMVLQFRPDALVRERLSGDLYIVSWKTASTFGPWTMNQCQTDMQSMSEVWGVETNRYDYCAYCRADMYPDERLCRKCGKDSPSIRIEGVLYLFAVKGQRKKDEYVGAYRQNSPLAYGWMRRGATEEDTEWAWRYGWDTEEINPKTGKAVGTKLGKGFRLVPIWSEYPGGVKAWIEDLATQRIAPRHLNALDGAFPQSLPVSRRADEIESWRRQVVAQETRTREAVEEVGVFIGTKADNERIDELFPQHTHSCFRFNSKCEFFEACWNPAVKADPLASGLYQISIPNHSKGDDDDE